MNSENLLVNSILYILRNVYLDIKNNEYILNTRINYSFGNLRSFRIIRQYTTTCLTYAQNYVNFQNTKKIRSKLLLLYL